MNAMTKAVVTALLLSTAACTAAEATEQDSTEQASDQAIATAPAGGGVEMYVGYEVRAEIRNALGQTEGEFDFGDVIVPGVLRIQHQYSVAVLRLEVSSWALRTDLTPPNVGSWGVDSALGVTFPRWGFHNEPDQAAAKAAAKKLFGALTNAKVTSETIAAGVVETTRASAHGSLACTRTTQTGRPDEFTCTVAGVGQVGGSGLLWDWSTAEQKAEQNAAKTP